MNITAEQLAAAAGSTLTRAQYWLQPIQAAMDKYAISGTPKRIAAFLAQVGHESGGLQYTSELWGPTDAQRRYEGRVDLGNVQPGDGKKFRGHGLIQTTGRANHARVRDRLRKKIGPWVHVPDFEQEPEALAQHEWAALSAADYWDDKGLNVLADSDDFERITRLINGGLNGQADRLARWVNGKRALGIK